MPIQEIPVIEGIVASFRPEVKSPGPTKAVDELGALLAHVVALGKASRVYMLEIFVSKGLKTLKTAKVDKEIENGKNSIETELQYIDGKNPLGAERGDVFPALLKMADDALKSPGDIDWEDRWHLLCMRDYYPVDSSRLTP